MKLFTVIISIVLLLFTTQIMYAAAKKAPSGVISVSAFNNKVKKAVQVTFGNLTVAKKISYTLLYEGNGIGQGVSGSFAPGKNKSISRSLLLGTCSRKVCAYHRNVKKIQLEVITSYKTGKTSTKMFNIK